MAPQPERRLAPQDPESLANVVRLLAAEPPTVSLAHMELRFPPVAQFLERFRALLTRRTRFDFDSELDGLSRAEQAIAFLAPCWSCVARTRFPSVRRPLLRPSGSVGWGRKAPP